MRASAHAHFQGQPESAGVSAEGECICSCLGSKGTPEQGGNHQLGQRRCLPSGVGSLAAGTKSQGLSTK